MKLSWRILGPVAVLALALAGSAAAKSEYGTLSGVVFDPAGTPQMGATVWLISEDAGGRTVSQLQSNQLGAFVTNHLKPGKYAVRVSLAGFLPTLERHVGVAANLTTLLRVQVDSLFSSLDSLRRSEANAEPDDWKWVLRSSAATRAILQWRNSDPQLAENTAFGELPSPRHTHGLVQVTGGALRPGSASRLSDSPATAMAYDQSLGGTSRILLAGQMSFERGASGALAGIWLPSGSFDKGPQTTFVMRQTQLAAGGRGFQGFRLDHTQQIAMGSRASLKAGAEYVRLGVVSSTAALHPHAQLDVNVAPAWRLTMAASASPAATRATGEPLLQSAMGELDSFPLVLFRNGRPVLEGAWHQELSVKHKLTDRASVEAAAFHDTAKHQGIFGAGFADRADFAQDSFSNAFLYDGGGLHSWGMRVGYRQRLSDNLDFSAVYARAAALSPVGDLNASTAATIRDNLSSRYHHSLAARVSGKIPRTGTQLAASYKWVSGTAVSRVDAAGESAFETDPNLHVSIRQPLPGLGVGSRWEALADFSNLLAQGYLPFGGQESRLTLVPVLRSFRGGVSFQF